MLLTGETEKRSFVHLNLVALAFTLGTILALILALGAVVVAPVVLSQLGLSGASETLIDIARWQFCSALVLGLTIPIVRPQPDHRQWTGSSRQCHCGSKLASRLRPILLVHSPFW